MQEEAKVRQGDMPEGVAKEITRLMNLEAA